MSIPANIYLFKINIEILEKGMKYRSGVFIVNIEHISQRFSVSIVYFEQVNVWWDTWRHLINVKIPQICVECSKYFSNLHSD